MPREMQALIFLQTLKRALVPRESASSTVEVLKYVANFVRERLSLPLTEVEFTLVSVIQPPADSFSGVTWKKN